MIRGFSGASASTRFFDHWGPVTATSGNMSNHSVSIAADWMLGRRLPGSDRATLLDRVMHNYRRFYMIKALFHYPWRGTGFRRRYLLGCLKAFLKAGFARTFYDLGKAGYWGPQTKDKVHFDFDESRTVAEAQIEDWEAAADRAARAAERREAVRAQGKARAAERLAAVKACGGGDLQMDDSRATAHAGS